MIRLISISKCADGLVAMTWAFQAHNSGSNPGRRIIINKKVKINE